MARKTKSLRDSIINSAEWASAKKRAKAILDHKCQMCHKDLDVTAKPYTPNAIEVDHIIPLARSGHPTELSNLQLLCFPCNRKKGTKLASDYEGVDMTDQFPLSNSW